LIDAFGRSAATEEYGGEDENGENAKSGFAHS
jgi:hypothetical protein